MVGWKCQVWETPLTYGPAAGNVQDRHRGHTVRVVENVVNTPRPQAHIVSYLQIFRNTQNPHSTRYDNYTL